MIWLLVVLLVGPEIVQGVGNETVYSTALAKKMQGDAEYRLFDGSRVDILTAEYAVEVDWAGKSLKWAEAIGQARYYAKVTGRKPAIILLTVEDACTEAEKANIHKCLIAAGDIPVWVVSVATLELKR